MACQIATVSVIPCRQTECDECAVQGKDAAALRVEEEAPTLCSARLTTALAAARGRRTAAVQIEVLRTCVPVAPSPAPHPPPALLCALGATGACAGLTGASG